MTVTALHIQGKEDPVKEIFPEVSQWVSGASGLPFAGFCFMFYSEISSVIYFYFNSDVSLIIVDYTIGNASASDYVDLESTETWLADYFNDAVMDFSPEELYVSLDHLFTVEIWLYKIT